jgi:hypothetical protein
MADRYVYYYMRPNGSAGRSTPSKRRATLEAIKGKGEPVIGGVSNDAPPLDEFWAQIQSLERRANSRDIEALILDENAEGTRKYMLMLESRELRAQALKLKKQRSDLMVKELDDRCGKQDFDPFPGRLNTE